MLAHNLAHGREPQAIAGQARGKKWFEDVLQGHLVHAASGIAYGNAHIAARPEVAMSERSPSHDLVHLRFDLDAAYLVHRLRHVVAKIENQLLQLSGLGGYDGCFRRLANN